MSDWRLWLLLIVVLVVLALVIWWWWKRRSPQAAPSAPETRMAAADPVAPPPITPDDLTIVEGIGPKTDAALKAVGICTLADLAATDVAKLQVILKDANLTLGDPTTWPQQAGLAAAGKMDELKTLQDSLKGGRRV